MMVYESLRSNSLNLGVFQELQRFLDWEGKETR